VIRKTLVDLELERIKELKKYFDKPLFYVCKIKSVAKRRDPKVKLILFGSLVKGSMRPDSDIDILIVTQLARRLGERLKLRMEIAKEIGEYTPFEIHIVTPEEYEGWYKRFLDEYRVI